MGGVRAEQMGGMNGECQANPIQSITLLPFLSLRRLNNAGPRSVLPFELNISEHGWRVFPHAGCAMDARDDRGSR